MSTLPDPPRGADGALIDAGQVHAFLATGVAGACVICTGGTWQWWDLSRARIPPVLDDTGLETDQLPLHRHCVPALLQRWADRLAAEGNTDEGSGAAAPETGAGTRTIRAPVGAYARRESAA